MRSAFRLPRWARLSLSPPHAGQGIIDRVLSTSFIAALGEEERGMIRKEVLAPIGAHPELKQARDIDFPYLAKHYLLHSRS